MRLKRRAAEETEFDPWIMTEEQAIMDDNVQEVENGPAIDIDQFCPHRRKKGLFRGIRFKSKKILTDCSTHGCERKDAQGLCTACGQRFCIEEHCKVHAIDDKHPMFLIIPVNDDAASAQIRCFICDKILEAEESAQGLVRNFLLQYQNNHNASANATKKNETDHANELSSSETGELTKNGSIIGQKSNTKNGDSLVFDFARLSVTGLANLGNSCFFNSIIQCITQTHALHVCIGQVQEMRQLNLPATSFVVDGEETRLDSTILCLDKGTPLVDTLGDLLLNARHGRILSPSALFNQIARQAVRFRGWQQQDAHELLRYLLDGLRQEELGRYKEAIASHLGVSVTANQRRTSSLIVEKAKHLLNISGSPWIDAVFGGSLLQSIHCSICGHTSRRMEPFLDLSLPIASSRESEDRERNGSIPLPIVASPVTSKHQQKKNRAAARKGKSNRRKSLSHSEIEPSSEDAEQENGIEQKEEEALTIETVDQLSDAVANLHVNEAMNGYLQTECETLCDEPTVEAGSDSHNLTDYLRAFSSPERLHGVNAYECDKCCHKTIEKTENKTTNRRRTVDAENNHGHEGRPALMPMTEATTKTTTNRRRTVDAEKRYLVHLPPNVLTVHLKRFQQVFCGTRRGRVETRKLNTPVRYPLILDLSPYCHRSAQRISSPDNRVLYSLYGVVCHSGNLSGGHYISYTKCRTGDAQRLTEQLRSTRLNEAFRSSSTTTTTKEPLPSTITIAEPLPTTTTITETLPSTITEPLPGQWWYASDSRVRKVDETVVLAQQTEAYILFYERVL